MTKRDRPTPPDSRAREDRILQHFQCRGSLSDLMPEFGLSRQRLHQLKNRALRRQARSRIPRPEAA